MTELQRLKKEKEELSNQKNDIFKNINELEIKLKEHLKDRAAAIYQLFLLDIGSLIREIDMYCFTHDIKYKVSGFRCERHCYMDIDLFSGTKEINLRYYGGEGIFRNTLDETNESIKICNAFNSIIDNRLEETNE